MAKSRNRGPLGLPGYAPGWQLRCPKCGEARPAAEAGIIRIGAYSSKGHKILAHCSGCKRNRMVYLERINITRSK